MKTVQKGVLRHGAGETGWRSSIPSDVEQRREGRGAWRESSGAPSHHHPLVPRAAESSILAQNL